MVRNRGRRDMSGKSTGVYFSNCRKWAILLTIYTLFLSGLGWLMMHEFVRVEGPFGPVHHWFEAWLLRLHGLATFIFIFFFGLLWGTHIKSGLKMKKRKLSGIMMMSLSIFLATTGLLLYYMTGDTLRNYVEILHWGAGIGFGGVFILHYIIVKRFS